MLQERKVYYGQEALKQGESQTAFKRRGYLKRIESWVRGQRIKDGLGIKKKHVPKQGDKKKTRKYILFPTYSCFK